MEDRKLQKDSRLSLADNRKQEGRVSLVLAEHQRPQCVVTVIVKCL